MEIKGKIKLINEAITVGQTFKKREVVITTEEQYPQDLMVEFVQDKCDLLNHYAAGETVTVTINLKGREWVSPEGKSKYFNTIQGWRIERNGDKVAPVPNEEDDLPF